MLFLPLAITLTAALTAPPRPVVVAGFCKKLTSDSIDAFAPLAANAGDLRGTPFESVRDLIRHYEGVEISRCEAVPADSATIALDVVGSGITRNSARKRSAIPRRWYLTFSSDGRIAAAEDEKRHVLDRLLAARSDSDRADVLAHSAAPASEIARCLVSRDAAGAREAALFLLSWSGAHCEVLTESYALCALGESARRSHAQAEAARLFESALSFATEAQSCDAVTSATYLAAMNAAEKSDKIDLLKRAANADALDDPRPALIALYLLARFDGDDRNRYDVASAWTDRLETYTKRFGSVEGKAYVSLSRAIDATGVNDTHRAVPLYRTAIAAAHRTGDAFWEARGWNNLGHALSDANEPKNAIAAFHRTLELIPHDDESAGLRLYANCWLGMQLVVLGRLGEAEALVDDALAHPADAAPSVFSLFFLEQLRYAQGRYAEAIAADRAGIALDPTSLTMTWALQLDLGNALAASGDREGAVDAYRASIDLVEARRALSASNVVVGARHFATRVPIYQKLENMLLVLHRTREALVVAEQVKARSLTDSLGGDKLPLTPSERLDEERLNRELLRANEDVIRVADGREAAARGRQQSARASLTEFEEEAALRHASVNAPSTWLDSSAAVAGYKGEPAIEYSIVNGEVIAFVIRGGEVVARRLGSAREIEKITDRVLRRIGARDLGYVHDAMLLHDRILAPVADLLPRGGTLLVIPEGFLWRVPFSALVLRDGKSILETHAIALAPSLTELRRASQLRSGSRATREVLAIGNPLIAGPTSKRAATYRGLSLGPIPEAAVEARTIAALYGSGGKALTGSAATETALKETASQYRVLHLATHGIIDGEWPLYSALVLSGSATRRDDGLLEMREINGLHLNARLVVLSGCDTANGKVYPGEGVVGLSWAFLRAGCPTVVVSQWKVESKATSRLMIEFHRGLVRGDSPAEALRRAELTLMKSERYWHPYYWAPFVVIGADQPLFRAAAKK